LSPERCLGLINGASAPYSFATFMISFESEETIILLINLLFKEAAIE
tara:strand:- start:3462 stop:3602 length:141 start_codon:yes stop_codon:yes gene_type:complete